MSFKCYGPCNKIYSIFSPRYEEENLLRLPAKKKKKVIFFAQNCLFVYDETAHTSNLYFLYMSDELNCTWLITQISERAQSGMDQLTSFADLSVLNTAEGETVSIKLKLN